MPSIPGREAARSGVSSGSCEYTFRGRSALPGGHARACGCSHECDAAHTPRSRRSGMTLRSKIRCVGMTDTGKVREHNEDTIATDGDIGLLVLADGMGGYNAGEVASGIAVKTVLNLIREQVEREDLSVLDRETGMSRPSIILRDAIVRANKIIYQTARTQPQCEGMGTTIVAAMFFDNKVSIAHVGDSRMYRLRSDRFEQVTMDHSLLQELVDRGFYSAEEAQRAANKNYVTRALGVEPNVDVELQEAVV